MGQYIIPGVFTLLVAIIEAIAAKERKDTKKENEKTEQRAALRAEESRLSMQMMSATLQLSVVTANALTGGHNNGNVEAAKEAAEEAMTEYTAFINKIASKEVSKL
jgi:DNA polymerase III delta prime subunit